MKKLFQDGVLKAEQMFVLLVPRARHTINLHKRGRTKERNCVAAVLFAGWNILLKYIYIYEKINNTNSKKQTRERYSGKTRRCHRPHLPLTSTEFDL